ncbi:hypothetical protein LCGC14_1047110, partial [marine sediment metagenome]
MTSLSYLDETNAFIRAGDWPAAQQRLIEAIGGTGGRFFLYHERLGDVYLAQGDLLRARASYDHAQALNPAAGWITAKLADLDSRIPAPPEPFCGQFDRYPDLTGRRQAEGGQRLRGNLRESRPDLPLVTIVTAVYDNSSTFQRCIDSVRAQTYPNVEYIIVDGGSPAGTLDILRANDDAIDYYISEPDDGIYSAMNKGIRLARGEYVCLLNSDDRHDPDFVTRSVETALAAKDPVDIVYSDFYDGDTRLPARPLDAGILLGNLNINHCTFLVHKSCYDAIGPYSEELRIVSDMVWIRRAYSEGCRFARLPEAYFRFSHGGLSSGNSAERRDMIIKENAACYRQDFPFLTPQEAETLYLLRFTDRWLETAEEIGQRHAGHPLFREALAGYVTHCLRDRGAFALPHTEADGKFGTYVRVADAFGVDRRHIRIATSQGCLSKILGGIADLPRKPAMPGRKRILHYATVFSAPSETFIYDLATRLEDETIHDNVFLYQQPQLRAERPYAKAVHLSWPDFRPEVYREIYRYIIETLGIDLIIAHFAINEHRLHQRVGDLGLEIPTIVMTHGIDVFKLKEPSAYRDHVMNRLAMRENVTFTAVSDYLRDELVAAGLAPDRITVLPNTVNDRFYRHRKTDDFHDGQRTLRLLCMGRLIAWKGHRHLIDALASFRDSCTGDFELTIVYGNGDDELKALRAQAA